MSTANGLTEALAGHGRMNRDAIKLGWVAVLAALILATQPASAEEDMDSAEYIMPGCRQFLVSNTPFHFLDGNCNGVVDDIEFASADLCAPRDSTLRDAVRVVVQYIDAQPDRQQESFRALAREALTVAWPCKPR